MAIKVLKVADKTTLDAIQSLLTNGTYGLSALNTDLDSIISSLGNTTYGLSAIRSLLANSTYGLSAIKTAISSASSGGGGYSSVTIKSTSHTLNLSYTQYTGVYGGKYFNGSYSHVNNDVNVSGSGKVLILGSSYSDIPNVTLTIDGCAVTPKCVSGGDNITIDTLFHEYTFSKTLKIHNNYFPYESTTRKFYNADSLPTAAKDTVSALIYLA